MTITSMTIMMDRITMMDTTMMMSHITTAMTMRTTIIPRRMFIRTG